MSKTIKQIADELGVSKETVRKKVHQLPPTFVAKVGGKLAIEVGGENLLISMISKKTANQKPPTIGDKIGGKIGGFNMPNDTVFDVLKKQLEEKDKQIKDLSGQLERTLQLLDQEQQLHAATKQLLLPQQKKKGWIAKVFAKK